MTKPKLGFGEQVLMAIIGGLIGGSKTKARPAYQSRKGKSYRKKNVAHRK